MALHKKGKSRWYSAETIMDADNADYLALLANAHVRAKISAASHKLLGITHLFLYNKLVHLPYVAVATNPRAN